MTPDRDHPSLVKLLRSQQAGVGTRLVATVISGLVFAAAGVLAGWMVGIRSNRAYVADEHLAAGFLGAGLVWAFVLGWVWRGQTKGVRLGRAVLGTCVIWTLAIAASLAVDSYLRRAEEEYLIAAICLLAGALSIYLWWDMAFRAWTSRQVLDADNIVKVMCPNCGYRLNGLNEIRCPECGATFTIDELIRAQNYAGATERRVRP